MELLLGNGEIIHSQRPMQILTAEVALGMVLVSGTHLDEPGTHKPEACGGISSLICSV